VNDIKIISTTFMYRGADKSLARPTSRCVLFDGENILFDASLVGRFHHFICHEGPWGE
jgi:hypothetical protein